MPTIGIVICYFGQWPPWFPLFLQTCRYNPTVHFLFFTDCPQPDHAADNLTFIPFSLDDFNSLASQKLGLSVQVTTPYKLCDFRPAFGVIFQTYLKEFDYWGYTDLDVIFGDIRRFITDDILMQHDVISSRDAYLSGHFTLYRNDEAATRLYEHSADYIAVFEEPRHRCFDECNFLWLELLQGRPLDALAADIDSMTHVVKRLAAQGRLRAYLKTLVKEQIDMPEQVPWKVYWDRGRLIDLGQGDEFLYFHFHTLARSDRFFVPSWRRLPERFSLTKYGFAVGWLPYARPYLHSE